MTYTLTPTEPDADIVAYVFDTEPALWDYVTETLGYEYGMQATDIKGTEVYGYHYLGTNDMCKGHVIGTVMRGR